MTHLRTDIRNNVVTTVTGLATTGARVFKGYAAPTDQLPCLLVTLEGREDVFEGAARDQERDLTVVISGFVKQTGDVDAVLDQIANEIETALAANPTLGGKCSASWLQSIDTGVDTSLDKPCGRVDLSYRAKYFTHAGSPGTLT